MSSLRFATMDWNTLLLWIIAPSFSLNLVASLRAWPRLWGWMSVSLVLIGITGSLYWLRPQFAGYVGGGLWAVFVLTPSIVLRFAQRAALQQQYNRASRWWMIGAVLHPFDGYRQQPRFWHAMHLADRLGEVDSAVAIFQQLQQVHPRVARAAKVQVCRLTGDWLVLIEWITMTIPPKKLLREASLLPMYVRALGETGQLSQMLQVVATGLLPAQPQMAALRGSCRLTAFAFCGQPQRVANVLEHAMSALPIDARQFWIATAELAAGMTDAGMVRLETAEFHASAGLKRGVENRRANPPVIAETILTDTDHALLQRLDREHDQEQRFAPAFGRNRRPWATYGLIVANVIMFSIEQYMGGTTNDQSLNRLGAMTPDVFQTHEYGRLFLANFLHYGSAHILMNMLGLLVVGPFVELNLGWLGYLALYLISGVGTMFTMLLLASVHRQTFDFLVGASGAIMALIGATAGILLRGWYRERAPMAFRRLRIIVAIVLLQMVFDHLTPQVSGAAHLIGVAWGFVLASVMPHRRAVRSPQV